MKPCLLKRWVGGISNILDVLLLVVRWDVVNDYTTDIEDIIFLSRQHET